MKTTLKDRWIQHKGIQGVLCYEIQKSLTIVLNYFDTNRNR